MRVIPIAHLFQSKLMFSLIAPVISPILLYWAFLVLVNGGVVINKKENKRND